MSRPLVSVVIATWNTGKYLPETVESALAQTWPSTEVIVVDDGSTDDTPARMALYASRIRYLKREHGGLAAARNAGIAAARGDYVALLDADDLWAPDKLAVQVDLAGRNPGSGLIACDGVEFEGGQVLRPHLLGGVLGKRLRAGATGELTGQFHREMLEGCPIGCPAQTLIPRPVLDAVGPFIDSGAQDYDCYLRIARRYPVTLHTGSLVRWRYRPESMSGPRDGRNRVWSWLKLTVLAGHARRCSPEERRIIGRRLDPLIRSLAYSAYVRGTEGDRTGAASELTRLLRIRPWPPVPIPYLVGLLAPGPLRTGVTRARRMTRRLQQWLSP